MKVLSIKLKLKEFAQWCAKNPVLCKKCSEDPTQSCPLQGSAASSTPSTVSKTNPFKATKVDGVYSADPLKNPDAKFYSNLTYDEILDKKLGVMDLTAICLCQEYKMPLRVFKMSKSGALLRAVVDGTEGTLVEEN